MIAWRTASRKDFIPTREGGDSLPRLAVSRNPILTGGAESPRHMRDYNAGSHSPFT